jgi:prolyl oligopeptidase PreP (S9A serine peptidase family)
LSAAAKRRALVVASGLALLGAAAAASVWPPPPRTEVRPVIDRIHDTDTVDPYRWLEDQNAPEVRRWIAEQNAYADAVLSRSGERPQLTALLRHFMDRPDVGRAQRGGAFEYFTLRREGEEQPAVYRRPAPAIRGERIDPSGTYELVVDPRALSGELTTSVDVMAVTAAGDRLIYGVRDGGQDERELVVRDLKTMTDVERFPAALYDSVSLRKDGAGFFYVRRSRETGARVRFHAWGARIDSDEVLFGAGYGPTAFVSMTQSDDATQFLYTVQHGWARSEVWLKSTAATTPAVAVVKDVDAHFYPRFVKQEIWMRTDLDAPLGHVIAVDMMGTSNGGLLVGAALTQRPDLFGGVLCGFPDVDMLRFNQHRRTNNMPALLEYGDAAIPEQFQAIRLFSPLQNVRPARYPAVMIWSGDLDTRVPPLAARKFTASLQTASTSGRPVILRYFNKGGHATNNGLPFSTRLDLAAAELAFAQMQLIPQ